MKHLNEAVLALHAGGDLGRIARWRVERHLRQCEACREELAAFIEIRNIAAELAEAPELHWNRLAAEMKANIRLGLAAGECVRTEEPPLRDKRWFVGMRGAVAFASAVALLVTGMVLQRPSPLARSRGIEVQSTEHGIQVREGAEALRLMHWGAQEKDVTYIPGAQGSMRARYMDPETGYVTVTNVYAD